MEMVIKMFTILGITGAVVGLVWAFVGFIGFLQSKKNGNNKGMDDGLEGVIFGGIVASVSGGIAAAIISLLGGISF